MKNDVIDVAKWSSFIDDIIDNDYPFEEEFPEGCWQLTHAS